MASGVLLLGCRPNITERNYETLFLLTSFALSLLLVFRTNSSYDR